MLMIRCILLLVALGCGAFGADFDGKWKAVFLGPQSKMPKMVPYIMLDLKTSGGVLTGMAHAGNWPGDMLISEGTIKGEGFSFTVYSDSPWRAEWPGGYAASGTPKLTFSGTLRNGVIEIKMTWDSIMLYGDKPEPREYEMRAKRTTP
jgi:hypothetical protein